VARSKRGAPDCRPRLISSFKGTLEVTCDTGEGRPYQFEIDLVRQSVRPLNPEAREVIEALSAKNRGLDGGSAPAVLGEPPPDSGR